MEWHVKVKKTITIENKSLLPPTTTGQILNPDLPVVSVALDLEREQGSPHTHPRAQLLYSIQGVMRVVTSLGTWLVPGGLDTRHDRTPGDRERGYRHSFYLC